MHPTGLHIREWYCVLGSYLSCASEFTHILVVRLMSLLFWLQIQAGLDSNGVAQPLEILATSRLQDNLLLAASCTGTVRLFDLRSSQRPAASLRPHDTQSLVRDVFWPCRLAQQNAVGTLYNRVAARKCNLYRCAKAQHVSHYHSGPG